jgi:hypothetical protein
MFLLLFIDEYEFWGLLPDISPVWVLNENYDSPVWDVFMSLKVLVFLSKSIINDIDL